MLELSTPPTPFKDELLSIGTPSTTNRGLFDLLIEVFPRILIFADAPTDPDDVVTCTPAAFAAKDEVMLTSLVFSISSEVIVCTAEEIYLGFAFTPSAVTTTSSNVLSVCICTS